MDGQTILALVFVSIAAAVVGYRLIAATKRMFSDDRGTAMGCGSCSGCPSKVNRTKPSNEPEIFLITPKSTGVSIKSKSNSQ